MLHVLYPDQIRRAASRKYELLVMNYSRRRHTAAPANNRLYAEFLCGRVIVRCLPCRTCSAATRFVFRYEKLFRPDDRVLRWYVSY